jgi:hypothetical protein
MFAFRANPTQNTGRAGRKHACHRDRPGASGHGLGADRGGTFVNRDGAGTLKLGQARGVAMLVPPSRVSRSPNMRRTPSRRPWSARATRTSGRSTTWCGCSLPGADPVGPDAADALAIALCHAFPRAHSGRLARRWRGGGAMIGKLSGGSTTPRRITCCSTWAAWAMSCCSDRTLRALPPGRGRVALHRASGARGSAAAVRVSQPVRAGVAPAAGLGAGGGREGRRWRSSARSGPRAWRGPWRWATGARCARPGRRPETGAARRERVEGQGARGHGDGRRSRRRPGRACRLAGRRPRSPDAGRAGPGPRPAPRRPRRCRRSEPRLRARRCRARRGGGGGTAPEAETPAMIRAACACWRRRNERRALWPPCLRHNG